MRYIGVSIDPGLETGACVFEYGDDTPMRVLHQEQFGHGAEGLRWWMEKHVFARAVGGSATAHPRERMMFGGLPVADLVVEKFTPRQNGGFSHTRASTEPLRCEGVLIGRGFGPHIQWAEPNQQYFMGASSLPLAEKKKLAREFLKQSGMFITGKDVGRPNADDAISATLHAVALMRRKRHMPTLEELFK